MPPRHSALTSTTSPLRENLIALKKPDPRAFFWSKRIFCRSRKIHIHINVCGDVNEACVRTKPLQVIMAENQYGIFLCQRHAVVRSQKLPLACGQTLNA